MTPEAEAISAAIARHQAGKGQFAGVTAGDVRAVALTVTSDDPVVAALLKGTDPRQVGPGKTVHQKVDDLRRLLDLAGHKAAVVAGPPSTDPTPKPVKK
jgi:hypothetical protein